MLFSHRVIVSSRHHVVMPPRYRVILSSCHHIVHHVIMSPSYAERYGRRLTR